MVFLGGFLTEVSKHNAEASLARWSGPPASMELAFLDPKGPKKVEKHFSVWFLILVPIFGLWIQKPFGRIHEHTGPFWGICW